MSLLALDTVSKGFNGVTAVDGVSFSVGRGEVVGFLGPNGAGKSTTMRMITQYLDPDAGSIRFDGVPLGEARLREMAQPERGRALDDAVQATRIESVYYRPIGELSKGFKQRTGLAAA